MNSADTAVSYLNAGLCVLPAILKEKRPGLPDWKQYQTELPSEQQVRTWFRKVKSMCIVTGAVSGNLELLDFDHGRELYPAWRELVSSESQTLLDRLTVERSQSAGGHVVFRCESPVPGNQKLAERTIVRDSQEEVTLNGKQYVPRKVGDHFEVTISLIETRGEGGLFLCAPTPGYVLEQGSFDNIPVITESERTLMIEAARALNESHPLLVGSSNGSSACGRPGDDFNQRGDVRAVLVRKGWKRVGEGDNEYWRRPGKTFGWSATLRNGVFYNFSSNGSPFESDQAYSPFGVYAFLEHAGDFSATASALRAEGYGDAQNNDVDLSKICGVAPDPGSKPVDPGPMPAEMYRVPGFISELTDHCIETAPYPNMPLAFCGAIALLAMLSGRKVRDSADNRTNLYLLALAYSSVGKDWPRKLNKSVMHRVGLVNALGENFASGEGIQDALFITPSMLYQTDEIDGLLQSINKAKDARLYGDN